MAFVVLFLIVGALATVAVLLARRLPRAGLLLAGVTAVGGFALGLGAGYVPPFLAGAGPGKVAPPRLVPMSPSSSPTPQVLGPEVLRTTKPGGGSSGADAQRSLAPGDRMPPLPAQWLNGPPPELPPAGHGVFVVDVWTSSCPMCRSAAPFLVDVYAQYKDRGVQFVSLTASPREVAEEFVQTLHIPWPCMYAAPQDTLLGLGALARGEEYSAVFPTLYVVGADGKVTWCDDQARYHHEEGAVIALQLRSALEAALAAKR